MSFVNTVRNYQFNFTFIYDARDGALAYLLLKCVFELRQDVFTYRFFWNTRWLYVFVRQTFLNCYFSCALTFSPTGEGLPKFVAIVSKLHMLHNQNLCMEKVWAISYIMIYTCHRNCSPFWDFLQLLSYLDSYFVYVQFLGQRAVWLSPSQVLESCP